MNEETTSLLQKINDINKHFLQTMKAYPPPLSHWDIDRLDDERQERIREICEEHPYDDILDILSRRPSISSIYEMAADEKERQSFTESEVEQ